MPAFIIIPNAIAYALMFVNGDLDGMEPVQALRSCGKRTDTCPEGNYNWFFASIGSHDFSAAYDHWDGTMLCCRVVRLCITRVNA